MPRFLVVLILLVVGWAPVSAIALGLGDINLKSALNQPFVAEIPVSTDSVHDLAALNIGVAPAATFTQYGLERASFLDEFEFEIVADGGSGVVRITSRNPIVEPFVTLLLEISWPQGRLLREFTVLLDPPVFAAEPVAPTVAAPQASPAPGPTRVVRRAPAEPVVQAAPVPAAIPTEPTPVPMGDSYGPVERADTLWSIAGRYAEAAGVNRNQMMLAIYRANPEAFVGNINRLKAGMILRIPDAAERQRLSRSEATAEVRRQNQSWEPETRDAGTLRLVPPPDVDEDVEPVGDSGAAGAAVGGQDPAELQGRVRQLEDELAESQRLIELQDQQLADLQNQAARAEQEVLPGVAEQPVEDTAADQLLVEEEPVAEETVAEETVVEEPPPAVTRPNVVTTTPAEEPSFLGGLFTNIWLYIGLGIALILALFVVRRRSAEPDAPPWSRLDDDGAMVGEESAEATQQLSPVAPTDTSFVVEEGVAERTDQNQAPFVQDADAVDFSTGQELPETPLERTISTDSPVNLDEADPIAEADFHMAYGLYDQAADLLSNALNEEPDRKDLRLKLLEVYFIWENQGGFLREAQALQARIDSPDDSDWNKVLIMGKQICPDEDLFSASPASPDVGSDMDFALTDDAEGGSDDGIDFDFSEEAADADVAFEAGEGGLDFDLSGDDLGSETDVDQGLDFDISEAEEATLMADDVDITDSPTMESPIEPPSGESTMETPTIESPALDATMESPIQPPVGETTLETPTIESEALETTMETPTIESPIGDFSESTSVGDQTAEIALDDLGLDLSDLEDAVDGVEIEAADEAPSADAAEEEQVEATGVNLAAETLQIEIDSLESLDDDTQRHKLPPMADDNLEGVVDVEATGEMPSLGDTAEQPVFGDTVEQTTSGGGSDTAEQPSLVAAGSATAEALIEPGETSADVDFDVGDAYADSDDTTSVVPASATVVNGATMTEVGTKLDLARAYIDMGDPDGARSILNEVLEEAADDQRQEAQKLLEDLDD